MEYYSAIIKNETVAICSNMDRPRGCHTQEVGKRKINVI